MDEASPPAPRHQDLIDLLGAYVDNELTPVDTLRLEAHLLGCASCRRAQTVQQAMHQRLATEPMQPAPEGLRQQIFAALATAAAGASAGRWQRLRRAVGHSRVPLWSGWATAAAMAAVYLLTPGWSGVPDSRNGDLVPMINAALSDYHQRITDELPLDSNDIAAVARDSGLPVELLAHADVQLLSTWQTDIRGKPAAALAYRWRNRIIIQYVIPQSLLFRQRGVREAVSRDGVYTVQAGSESVIAWSGAGAGMLLVGEAAASDLAGLTRHL